MTLASRRAFAISAPRWFTLAFTFVWTVGYAVGLAPACKSSEAPPASEQAPAVPAPTPQPTDVHPAGRTTASPTPAAESEHWAFLYTVTKGAATNHILGTMHLGFDYQALPETVWRRLAASERVAVEVDLRSVGVGFADKAALPVDQALSTLLGQDTWTKLVAALEGFPPAQLDRLRPWAAMNLLLARMFPTAVPLDLAVVREAERASKTLVFLETVDQQLALIAKVMDAEAIAGLLDESSAMRKQLSVTMAAYQKGDYDTLMTAALDVSAYGGDPKLLDTFIYDRNLAWVDKLLPELSRGGIFVAVGAAHLAGDKGLIAQLRKHGFEVSRVAK